MRTHLAEKLLAKVLEWDVDTAETEHQILRLLSDLKYDEYQQFLSGRRFIENLALWLDQFCSIQDRKAAYRFVKNELIFVSNREMLHLVRTVYPHHIVPALQDLAASRLGIDWFKKRAIQSSNEFRNLQKGALFLGLSDGARTDQLRRANPADIDNDQLWHAYELSESKARSLRYKLSKRLGGDTQAKFTTVWLLDDFSASGRTYIRWNSESNEYEGKIEKVYTDLFERETGRLVDSENCQIHLVLYVATEQARDHIISTATKFCETKGYQPPKVTVIFLLKSAHAISHDKSGQEFVEVIESDDYYDHNAYTEHFKVGGTDDAKWGFAACALPVVLAHNTPNNSIYLLWGPEEMEVHGLFPRVSRHKES